MNEIVQPKKRKLSKFSRAFFGIGNEKKSFFENLALLLSSGMNLNTAVDSLIKELRNKNFKALIEDVRGDLNEGHPFSYAINKADLFPPYIISLITIGEQSGTLVKTLEVISKQQEKEQSLRSKIRSAMLYPVLVFSMTLIVGIGISWFILPRLATVFNNLKIELPAVTRALMSFGEFLSAYGTIAVPGIFIFLVLFFYFIFYYPKTNFIGQTILFSLPISKKLIQEIEITRFGYMFGVMLASGIPILEATRLLDQVAGFRKYKKFYKFLGRSFEVGNSFEKSFAEYKNSEKLFPFGVQQMIVGGEQSGRLADTLSLIGRKYEEKTDETTKNLSVLIEPLLLFVIWGGVVLVAIAVILPIYSLVGNLNGAQ